MTPLEEVLKQEILKLQRKNADLVAENKKLIAENARLLKPDLVPHMGLLWKRAENGFEPSPYCPECKTHAVMTPVGGRGIQRLWVCPNGHEFQRSESVKPPSISDKASG
jgi:hypothetical protein